MLKVRTWVLVHMDFWTRGLESYSKHPRTPTECVPVGRV